jgi:peptidyl-prolyl cis-trans isomerase SurA
MIRWKYLVTALLFTFITVQVNAQTKDPVLMTVNSKPVTKSEFENIFKKNNKDAKADKAALDEYMELFTNFKLKVCEAEELGMDTISKFTKELNGYRDQLKRPYLTDTELNEELVKEAYERMKEEVRASHILIKVEPTASPEDTLKAYKRIMKLRKQAISTGDFDAAVVSKGGSEDPSAAKNKGDLGFFSALQMVYPFENAAYNLKKGEVCMPIRTRYGYHIIKLTERRPARGQIKVAHIMIKSTDKDAPDKQANAKQKINEIAGLLDKGDDFAATSKQYSDDKGSATKGGELPMFGTGKMVPEFEDASFNLAKDGDYSKPFQTSYGWHIVKRLELKPIPGFEEAEGKLKSKIARDSRSKLTKTSFVSKLKKDYNFVAVSKIGLKNVHNVVDESILKGEWDAEKGSKLNGDLFKFAGKTYTEKDFIEHLVAKQRKERDIALETYINERYERFITQTVMDYEDSRLEEKYPDFRMLMKEYRDGILLFELTDQKVWTKAVKDSAGLQGYYDEHKTEFMWDKRNDATIYKCANAAVAKQVYKLVKKKKADDVILETVNKDSQLNLSIESGKFTEKEQPSLIDVAKGLQKPVEGDNGEQMYVINLREKLNEMPKELSEARGLITADYQTHLEKEWIKELKGKYKVTVNKEVLYSIQ